MNTSSRLTHLIQTHRHNLEALEQLGRRSGYGRALNTELERLLGDDSASKHLRQQYREELVSIYAPLLSGTLDLSDENALVDGYLDRYGELELTEARKEVLLHCKLAQLYELMASAPDSAWRELLTIKLGRRVRASASLVSRYLHPSP